MKYIPVKESIYSMDRIYRMREDESINNVTVDKLDYKMDAYIKPSRLEKAREGLLVVLKEREMSFKDLEIEIGNMKDVLKAKNSGMSSIDFTELKDFVNGLYLGRCIELIKERAPEMARRCASTLEAHDDIEIRKLLCDILIISFGVGLVNGNQAKLRYYLEGISV